jgi:hypothetical protein
MESHVRAYREMVETKALSKIGQQVLGLPEAALSGGLRRAENVGARQTDVVERAIVDRPGGKAGLPVVAKPRQPRPQAPDRAPHAAQKRAFPPSQGLRGVAKRFRICKFQGRVTKIQSIVHDEPPARISRAMTEEDGRGG